VENLLPFLIEHGYVVLFFWVMAETMGLPIPSVPLFITMGALAEAGQVNLFVSIGLGVAAALLSDVFWYSMGRLRGRKVLSFICRITLEPDSCVRRTQDVFARYGASALLLTKFFPGMGVVSMPLAGVIRMRLLLFLLLDGLGAFIWVGAYSLIGYVFSKQVDRALAYAMGMGKTFLIVVAGGLAIYVLRKYISRRMFIRDLFIRRITPRELMQKLDAGDNVLIIDVRQTLDFEADPSLIPGALRIPYEQLEKHPPVPHDREIIIYCT
jgi:membrane protein DedA with SNARE-associated domain